MRAVRNVSLGSDAEDIWDLMLLKLMERNRKMKEHLASHAAPSHFTCNDQVYGVLPKAINHVRKYIIKEAQKRQKFRNNGMAPGANLYPTPTPTSPLCLPIPLSLSPAAPWAHSLSLSLVLIKLIGMQVPENSAI